MDMTIFVVLQVLTGQRVIVETREMQARLDQRAPRVLWGPQDSQASGEKWACQEIRAEMDLSDQPGNLVSWEPQVTIFF